MTGGIGFAKGENGLMAKYLGTHKAGVDLACEMLRETLLTAESWTLTAKGNAKHGQTITITVNGGYEERRKKQVKRAKSSGRRRVRPR